MIPPEWLGPYLASNLIALVLLGAAWRWPRAVRWTFVLIFAAAAVANSVTVLRDPASYLDYARWALLDGYRAFILGAFAEATQAFVLAIAVGQATVAVLLTLRAPWWRLGALGAATFLLAIAPLGIGAALPFSFTAVAAVAVMAWRSGQREGVAGRPAGA